jgi:hypothetical protein
MHIWTNLLAREGALLFVLLALGAAPVAFLSERFDAAARVALTPILGFCLGTCLTTTILEVAPARQTYWLLIPLALASLGIASWRSLHMRAARSAEPKRLSLRDLVQLLAVCAAVAAPLTYTLHAHHTVGPAAYTYTDVDNYVGEEDGARTTSIGDAREAWERSERTGDRFADLTQWDWSFFASFNANPNAAPLDANLDELLGLGATDTNSSFLIVLLLAGALGVFAAIRYATQSRTWTAPIAGAMFGGPLFLELWFDTFQAAIIALGLLMPFVMLGCETLRSPRLSNITLFALVIATLLTVYPVFVPILLVVSGLVVGWRLIETHRRDMRLGTQLRSAAAPAVSLVVLVLLFDNVGFSHVLDYYHKLLDNVVPLPRVTWHLPIQVLPGWLLQTREFWNMPTLDVGGIKQILLAGILPVVFLWFIILGIRRYRPALVLVALAGVCALVAEYSYSSNDACTYCAERDLLPLAPIVIVLVALGLATALAAPRRWTRALGIAGVALMVVAVGQRARVELTRFANGSYFLDSASRDVLARLPADAKAVQLEGFGQTTSGQAEQPLVYHLANEHARGRVSISLASNANNSIGYLDFGVVKPPGPEFHVDYDYVLTRFAGIQTSRRVLARSGAIALEQRIQRLDVTPYSGLEAPLQRLDRSGTAWVQTGAPLQFHVVGAGQSRAWARLVFRAHGPVSVTPQAGTRARQQGDTLVACVPATGSGPVRQAAIQLTASGGSSPPLAEEFPPPLPIENVALTSMRAVDSHCAL